MGVLLEIAEALRAMGIDLGRLGAAWARALPLVVLVPAFGLRALSAPARVTLGLAFALAIFPAMASAATVDPGASPALAALPLATEVMRGLPIAIATAVPLWAATMAGGLADSLRNANEGAPFAVIEGRATPLAVLFSLGAATIFFASGGPARAALALVAAPAESPWLSVAANLTNGITLAVAIAAPVLAASIVLEVAGALIARAASPAHVDAILQPTKALALLVVVALAFDRMLTLLR